MDPLSSSCSTDSSTHASYDSDEPPELTLDLAKLENIASSLFSCPVTGVRKLTHGRYHEIFVLSFGQDASSASSPPPTCIARFPRSVSYSSPVEHSTIATMRYVGNHTTIPVPEIYHVSTDAETASVGASFVLMQHMPGVHLYKLWGNLSVEDKLVVVQQIAGVVAELGSMEFDKIGMLEGSGDEVVLRGLASLAHPGGRGEYGPWETTEEWMLQYLEEDKQDDEIDTTTTYSGHLDSVKQRLHTFLASHSKDPSLQAPFGLLHTDFDAQNLLFTKDPQPKLTAVIDWDYAHTAPKYFIYDFPIFLQNDPYHEEDWDNNKLLRHHFIRSILQHLGDRNLSEKPNPRGKRDTPGKRGKLSLHRMLSSLGKRNHSGKSNLPGKLHRPGEKNGQITAARSSFTAKSYLLNRYVVVFMTLEAPPEGPDRTDWHEMRESMVKYFLEDLKKGTGDPYDGGWYQGGEKGF